uniref:Nucleotide-diphospho-sugar transferase domain-containing protein n=1 Tax=Onchocerca volvulus TaxID=6282 RepID=A0A8R1XN15_ONCVO
MRRQRKIWGFIIISLIFALIIYEEVHVTSYYLYKNYYSTVILRNITVRRSEGQKSIPIAIITILMNCSNYDEYRLAQESFECYALYHNYKRIVIDLSANVTLQKLCPHEDFMFARHCVTAEIMKEASDIQWFLFVDADMGVINPNHLIEEWIDNNVNIILYNRIFNHEVMAGSYLVKNTPYSRKFLQFWADYELKLSFSAFGSDNGAIHNVLLEFIFSQRVSEREFCENIWMGAKNYDDLSIYVACVRNIIDEATIWPNKLRILPKGEAWARDTWLTDSMWSERDFILHGWQKRKIDRIVFAGWPSPFVSHNFNLSLCTNSDTIFLNWQYKDTFIRSNFEVEGWLNKTIIDSRYDFEKHLKLVASQQKQ